MRTGQKHTASRLKQRMTLQQEVRTSDSAGGFTRSWQDVVTLWAEIIPLSGKEHLYGLQLEESVTHRLLIRYRAGVTAGMRLTHDGRIFHIVAVINTGEANDTLEMLAVEGVAS